LFSLLGLSAKPAPGIPPRQLVWLQVGGCTLFLLALFSGDGLFDVLTGEGAESAYFVAHAAHRTGVRQLVTAVDAVTNWHHRRLSDTAETLRIEGMTGREELLPTVWTGDQILTPST